MDLKSATSQLPPFIARNHIDRFLPGVISSKTLANLANRGLGPKFFKNGRLVIYRTADLVEWIAGRSKAVSTADQAWADETSEKGRQG